MLDKDLCFSQVFYFSGRKCFSFFAQGIFFLFSVFSLQMSMNVQKAVRVMSMRLAVTLCQDSRVHALKALKVMAWPAWTLTSVCEIHTRVTTMPPVSIRLVRSAVRAFQDFMETERVVLTLTSARKAAIIAMETQPASTTLVRSVVCAKLASPGMVPSAQVRKTKVNLK